MVSEDFRLEEVKKAYIDGLMEIDELEELIYRILKGEELRLKLPRPDLDETHMANDEVEFY